MEIRINDLVLGDGKPKICVPIVSGTNEAVLEEAEEILNAPCDIVEFRADFYENVKDADKTCELLGRLKQILSGKVLLFTIRTKKEGGNLDISYNEYSRILRAVAESRLAELIDVECYMDKEVPYLISDIQACGIRVVGSNHDFYKTDSREELCARLQYISDTGADMPKLAVMPNVRQDVVNLLTATYDMSLKLGKPVITMAMGKLGTISRISGATFGSAVTFGSVRKASAPGQISATELKNILDIVG